MRTRLQKVLAAAGVASRRGSEALIVAGRVSVNGAIVTQLGSQADPAHDEIRVDGAVIHARRRLYVLLNKPAGYVCSRQPAETRPKVGDLLPREWASLFTVGRLDRDSEGLLILTNDGDFCLRLTHPRFGVPKTYRVRVVGRATPAVVHRLREGLVDAGERLQAEKARLLSANASHSTLEVTLREGKNREIRRMLESQGLEVDHLARIRIGPLTLGELPRGKYRVLRETEIRTLLETSQETREPQQRSVARPQPKARADTARAIQGESPPGADGGRSSPRR
ncbi:MAG TPA: pseudouridine synthase [Verrucomicrobiota bacterium]|nr:pseudouridine synthase [Verrucomicrobiota bacterium]HNU49628.1 pseudouridine synthase [Verrucomicrobiota bacterium]